MVSNPAWRRSASEFATTVRSWLLRPDPEGLMALAIFIDAHAVAGDASLLAGVRAEVDRLVATDDALLGRFAAAIDSFPESGGSAWWNRLLLIGEQDKQTLDLKKAGIFPIVHGVRSLALRQHVAGHRHRRAARCAGRGGPPAGGVGHRPHRQPALPDGTEAESRARRARHRAAGVAAAFSSTA